MSMGKRKNKTFHIIKTLNETYIILLWDKLVMSIFNTQNFSCVLALSFLM